LNWAEAASFRNRKGFILIDALICTVITSVCATLVASALLSHVQTQEGIERKAEILEEKYEEAAWFMESNIDCEEEDACKRGESEGEKDSS
jgi:type II secretory pathway component PulJ